MDTIIGAVAIERPRRTVTVFFLVLIFKVHIKGPETTVDYKKNGYQKCRHLTGIHQGIGPRIGLLRHGAASRGLRRRLRPGPAAAGSLGPGAKGAAGARRRTLARSLPRCPARTTGRRAGGRPGRGRAPRRPGSLGPGAGRLRSRPPSPAAAAAAPLRL